MIDNTCDNFLPNLILMIVRFRNGLTFSLTSALLGQF